MHYSPVRVQKTNLYISTKLIFPVIAEINRKSLTADRQESTIAMGDRQQLFADRRQPAKEVVTIGYTLVCVTKPLYSNNLMYEYHRKYPSLYLCPIARIDENESEFLL